MSKISKPMKKTEFIGIILMAVIITLLLNAIFYLLGKMNLVNIEQYQTDISEIPKTSGIIGVLLVAPIVEELIYRAGICGLIELLFKSTKFKEPAMILTTAFVFGISHKIPLQQVYAFICGLILGFLYLYEVSFCNGKLKTTLNKNLNRSILFHMTFNAMGLILYTV